MKKILVLYHYYRPDDVVSAVHKSELCEELSKRGWEAEAWPSNRSCHHPGETYSLKPETLQGVHIRRVWRPPFRQHSFLGRIANSLWMEGAWTLRLLFSPKTNPDVILTGTDPIFTVLLTPLFRLLRPKARQVHWCFDLYPEFPIAEGMVSEHGLTVRSLRWFLRRAYRACDLVADLGPCMKERLSLYPVKKTITLTPWALEEPGSPLPFDPTERKSVFGDAAFGLMYSGNLGRAHSYSLTLRLARLMGPQAVFAYSARGSRLEGLKRAVTPADSNIRFIDFAPPGKLRERLSSPDVHIVSLQETWTGVAVPSKFFGALAAGRPVLFEGTPNSSIARWIREHGVGWVLGPDNLEEVARDLILLSQDPSEKDALFRRCNRVYRSNFSKQAVTDRWDEELRLLLPA